VLAQPCPRTAWSVDAKMVGFMLGLTTRAHSMSGLLRTLAVYAKGLGVTLELLQQAEPRGVDWM